MLIKWTSLIYVRICGKKFELTTVVCSSSGERDVEVISRGNDTAGMPSMCGAAKRELAAKMESTIRDSGFSNTLPFSDGKEDENRKYDY